MGAFTGDSSSAATTYAHHKYQLLSTLLSTSPISGSVTEHKDKECKTTRANKQCFCHVQRSQFRALHGQI